MVAHKKRKQTERKLNVFVSIYSIIEITYLTQDAALRMSKRGFSPGYPASRASRSSVSLEDEGVVIIIIIIIV